MELNILGSNSCGNCYILTDTQGNSLIIEAGVHTSKIYEALDFDLSKVVGCLVTHEHGDHAKSAGALHYGGVPVYASEGTIKKVGLNTTDFLISEKWFNSIHPFKVLPFEIEHDAAQPLGFLIYHEEMGYTLFLTDTYVLSYNFTGLNNIIIEANYCQNIIENRPIQHKDRVIENHMSIQNCLFTLNNLDLKKVNNIVLIHLSDGNSNSAEFKEKVEKATLKNVTIAKKDLKMNFNRTPF